MTEQTGATPAAGATPASSGASTDATAGATPTSDTDAQALAALGEPGKRALDAMKATRDAEKRRADAAEAELQKHRDAQLSELEKANKRAEAAEKARSDAESSLRERTVQSAVVSAAAAANFVNPDLAARLIATSDVELDTDGSPKNAEKLVADLAKQYPYLVRSAGSFDQGARTNGAAAAPVFRASQINDRAFWEKNREAIMLAQREGRIVLDG